MAHQQPISGSVPGGFPALRATHMPPWLTYGVEALLMAWLWGPVLAGNSQTLESAARRAAVWRGWARVTRR